MYRQVLIAPEDQNFQRIVWRYNSSDEICEYKLNTVTYGLSSASFLTTRCLKQIAINCTDDLAITKILEDHVYMDDVISGCSTVIAHPFVRDSLLFYMLNGSDLRKWKSNYHNFLDEFKEHCAQDTNFEIAADETAKVLGIFWNSASDTINFKVMLNLSPPFTKRQISSESAHIFDPLGFFVSLHRMDKDIFSEVMACKRRLGLSYSFTSRKLLDKIPGSI
ncbi:hypothetical protein AVEN_180529-1 [Araneus ventricosus]|uniref:Uncharacterized protein n=1 Tax=Araneus ventricosus TaxID=182803 RepID=A0A4Y2FJL0_ARAVE|nr:hypothetical protein AVEN_180529-1 [Araneus ventricosus]